MASTLTNPRPFSNDYAGLRNVEVRRDFRFRYGYICRLIDDAELKGMPAALRARTRSVHKETYWKSVSLLRRDAERVLRLRREKMAAQQAWDFQALLNDYARVQLLLAKLTVAGMSHSIRLGAGLESAREACREFENFLAQPTFALSASA
jgi:hypothetical protein